MRDSLYGNMDPGRTALLGAGVGAVAGLGIAAASQPPRYHHGYGYHAPPPRYHGRRGYRGGHYHGRPHYRRW